MKEVNEEVEEDACWAALVGDFVLLVFVAGPLGANKILDHVRAFSVHSSSSSLSKPDLDRFSCFQIGYETFQGA